MSKDQPEPNVVNLFPLPERRRINLADLGFTYRVSDEARAEIDRNARRANRVLETAHKFWFKGH